MKKTIVIYLSAFIAFILVRLFVHMNISHLSVLSFFLVNMILPSIILLLANAALNMNAEFSVKKCLIHAVALGVVLLGINLTYTQFFAGNVVNQLISQSASVAPQPGQESQGGILDALDEQARKKLIEEGVIQEGDELYSEPYTGEETESVPTTVVPDEELRAEWDVQIQGESTQTMITGTFLNILIAFIGGFLGYKGKDWLAISKKS